MNTPINDGGPAFPQVVTFSPNGEPVTAGMYFSEGPGMSLRDWFAGQALAGLCSDYIATNTSANEAAINAKEAYRIADAMLAARAEGGGK